FGLANIPASLDNTSIPLGRYRLVTHKDGTSEHQFRLGHPLAEWLLATAKRRSLPVREVVFQYQPPPRMSLIENLKGRTGWLRLSLLSIESLERENHLILTGMSDDGTMLDTDTCVS